MGRIILVLIAACLVATFMIINNSTFKSTTPPPSNANAAAKKTERDRPRARQQEPRAGIAKKGSTPRSKAPIPNDSLEPLHNGVATSENGNNQDDQHAIVKGDQTPVYSVNSRDSNIMKMLNKGDRVSTDVQVTDGQGKWTIVKKGDLTRPGFVLDESLQRSSGARRP